MVQVIIPELNEKPYEIMGWGKISIDLDNSLVHSSS